MDRYFSLGNLILGSYFTVISFMSRFYKFGNAEVVNLSICLNANRSIFKYFKFGNDSFGHSSISVFASPYK